MVTPWKHISGMDAKQHCPFRGYLRPRISKIAFERGGYFQLVCIICLAMLFLSVHKSYSLVFYAPISNLGLNLPYFFPLVSFCNSAAIRRYLGPVWISYPFHSMLDLVFELLLPVRGDQNDLATSRSFRSSRNRLPTNAEPPQDLLKYRAAKNYNLRS